MVLTNGPNQYSIDSLVAKSHESNFYVCSSGDKKYFLQIAATTEQNGKLDFASYILKDLKQVSDKLEAKFRTIYPGEQLNYDWLFPTVVDNFKSSDQGNRTVSILAINGNASIDQMAPLSNILYRDRKIVDLATSVWIIGRLLKLLILAHDQCISLKLDSDNVIIEPKTHRVVILDWTGAKLFQNGMTDDERGGNINRVALIALELIGEKTTGNSRYPDNVYVEFLKDLAISPRGDTERVYADFEEAHGQIFERTVFYPFTTFPV